MKAQFINSANAFNGRMTGVLYRIGGKFTMTIYARNYRSKTVVVARTEGTRSECVRFRNLALRNTDLLQ